MARGTYLPKTNKRILEVQTAQAVHFRRCEKNYLIIRYTHRRMNEN